IMKKYAILAGLMLAALVAAAQDHHHDQQSTAGQGELNDATSAMGHAHHHDAGPHMLMSKLRDPQPGDAEKAQNIVDQARTSLERYQDYKAALADGFQIFLPNLPQPMYHFTNYKYAFAAAFTFDPTKPTSLLYEKNGSGYKLIGAMYTAPVRFTEDQINERIPLSMAQWHQHVNMCKPPKGQELEQLSKNAKFGLRGSISTKEACDAAGGTFMPHVFGWMVHVYPWEKTPDAIWSVERQLKKPGDEHDHHDHN
ncbi:MAG TPA: hypothetical protein VEW69_10870, partial [Alphaproteobacteria bacterium]|nr:hypothetical protein [Alphaproteobacteria bacterium]